ncbi:MAG: Crp/Fnr family transcriptional regulator [Clostridia bacterium]|nr:Crp/Fnr family transcriptional regulator [Clostridia bacterium]
MEKYLKLLSESKIFEGVKEEEILKMLNCLSFKIRSYKKGEYIFLIGDKISSAAIVLEGTVHIQKEDYWGNLSILNEMSEGDIFGEAYSASLSGMAENNAVAVKECVILYLNLEKILTVCSSLCDHHNTLIKNIYRTISAKNLFLTQKIGYLSQRTTREKLFSYLSDQSVKAKSATFTIPFNRQQLADFLAVDRSAMCSELSKMQKDGIISYSKNTFTLKEI